ncbi:MAG TPA: hypothetical protein VMG12_28150 [Polyangiaceae bacterium]|nr:hypothetical protein [Polyangiaceae bacterium]
MIKANTSTRRARRGSRSHWVVPLLALLGCGDEASEAPFDATMSNPAGGSDGTPGASSASAAAGATAAGAAGPGAAGGTATEASPGAIPLSNDANAETPGTSSEAPAGSAEPDVPRGPTVALTIEGGAGPFGAVRSTPAGVDCSAPPCRVELPRGTALRLDALSPPAGGIGFAGWSGACEGIDDCILVLDGDDVTLTATFARANVVFVTSTLTTGRLGNLTQADAICSERARAGQLTGIFRAWLATQAVGAIDRLMPSRGWVRRDGRIVVDSPSDLVDGKLFHPLNLDEFGTNVGSTRKVWTGTGRDLRVEAGSNCNDWTAETAPDGGIVAGRFGDAALGGKSFTTVTTARCDDRASLYCFEVGKTLRMTPQRTDGRAAFASSGRFALDGGVAGADSLCQNDAAFAGLSGSFKALLSTSTASAASRFDLTGAPWVRLDGVPLAPTAAALFQAETWDTSLNLSPSHAYYSSVGIVVGGSSMLAPGSLEDTCSDWTSLEGTTVQGDAAAASPTGAFSSRPGLACSSTNNLVYCLEE